MNAHKGAYPLAKYTCLPSVKCSVSSGSVYQNERVGVKSERKWGWGWRHLSIIGNPDPRGLGLAARPEWLLRGGASMVQPNLFLNPEVNKRGQDNAIPTRSLLNFTEATRIP